MNRLIQSTTAALAALVCVSAAVAAERPNIILCMTDDQGWGDVGYNGHPRLQTPVLDEMAAKGLRFDRFYAADPVCSPTRASVLSGRHPIRSAVFSWGLPLRPQEFTIAEGLKRGGYATGHFGKWHLGDVGADDATSPGAQGFDEWVSSPNFYENDPLFSHNGKVIETKGESSMVTVEKALEFVGAAAKMKQPFLAVVWFGNPHLPHEAEPELRELYKDLPANLQNYYGEITGVDRAMGRLRERLRELGIADDTIVWFTADNGHLPPGTAAGLRGQKSQVWEGGIRVPTVLEWPARVKQPRRIAVPSGTVDIYPTLLEIAGVTVDDQPGPVDGESIAALIEGREFAREKPLGFWKYSTAGSPTQSNKILREMQAMQNGEEVANPTRFPDWRITRQYPEDRFPGHAAWIDGKWKLHRIAGRGAGGEQWQLYDLENDSAEETDVAANQADVVNRMRGELEEWQKSVLRSLNGKDYP
ncbi:MAG: sulfatase-like hydrolase/transferase [Planctomycetaceae bacterium]